MANRSRSEEEGPRGTEDMQEVGSMVTYLTIAGLLLGLVGVVMLFLFGMPFRVRTEGKIGFSYMLSDADRIIRKERLHGLLGWVGLVLIIASTGFQIAAALLQR